MPHDHWTVLKNLDVATAKPRPIKVFDQAEGVVLLHAFEHEEIGGEVYGTSVSVANSGKEVITTPHDGQTLLTQSLWLVWTYCKMRKPQNATSGTITTCFVSLNTSQRLGARRGPRLCPGGSVAFPAKSRCVMGSMMSMKCCCHSLKWCRNRLFSNGMWPIIWDTAFKPLSQLSPPPPATRTTTIAAECRARRRVKLASTSTNKTAVAKKKDSVARIPQTTLKRTGISTPGDLAGCRSRGGGDSCLVAAPAHYPLNSRANPLSQNTPNLSFHVLSYLPSATDMKSWEEVLG